MISANLACVRSFRSRRIFRRSGKDSGNDTILSIHQSAAGRAIKPFFCWVASITSLRVIILAASPTCRNNSSAFGALKQNIMSRFNFFPVCMNNRRKFTGCNTAENGGGGFHEMTGAFRPIYVNIVSWALCRAWTCSGTNFKGFRRFCGCHFIWHGRWPPLVYISSVVRMRPLFRSCHTQNIAFPEIVAELLETECIR